jgi:hypothetical protein
MPRQNTLDAAGQANNPSMSNAITPDLSQAHNPPHGRGRNGALGSPRPNTKEALVMSTTPSIARLAAATHESIMVTFEPEYRPPTPGSSAWSIIAKNIRLRLVVPSERPRPNWILARMLARTSDPNPDTLVDQFIVLQAVTDGDFSGEALLPVKINAGASGQVKSYKQRFEFFNFYSFYNEDAVMFELDRNTERLVDPINHSPQFQVDMFEASPFSRTDMGLWSTVI